MDMFNLFWLMYNVSKKLYSIVMSGQKVTSFSHKSFIVQTFGGRGHPKFS